MHKDKFSIKSIPGWVYTLIIFGFLYLTGLHTEAIGQVQRALLATGIIQPTLKPQNENTAPINVNAPTVEPFSESVFQDFLLQDLNGNVIKFSTLKNKVIFLNIWATWCPPCVAEMPGIQGLYDKMKGNKNIAFVMLSVDEGGIAKVKKFIAKKDYTFPVYMPAGSVPAMFQTQTIPTTFILDKNGKIATRHDGMADYDTKKVQDYLNSLAR
ncbi:TlpA family protein disulfide reductase [Adhaeribacter terreus]|uniref:TlpA family protein disulfide reductase n=1 Tax=Adhaeribacter terreus TaxID=529703 RepID=A0ABW0E8S4_9BACT